MRLTSRWQESHGFAVRRTTEGVVELRADDDFGLARGLGFAHAHDRQVQMMLLRLVGQGRLSECLEATDETLAVDIFARQMGFARSADTEGAQLTGRVRRFADAYAAGVNDYLTDHRRPAEFLLLGYRPEPWRIADTLLTIKVMSYVGLAQGQGDLEKLIIQSLAGGVRLADLQALFSPHLDAVDDDLVALLKRTRIEEGVLPDAVRVAGPVPKMVASNNWAVAADRSASGNALECHDPHLEVNRLPAIWYEWIGHTRDDYRIGISMPGVPGYAMGRNTRVSGGFTYGYMDMVDYFVEDVRGGRCRRDDVDEEITVHSETIRRKGEQPIEIEVRETSHGVLEADPRKPLADGLVLCRAWSGDRGPSAPALDGLLDLMGATNVERAQQAVRQVTISSNWLFADRSGRIAYQQAGLLPARKHSGLHPVRGWDPAMAWDGYVDPERLSSILDPESGVLATANDDVDQPGSAAAVNVSMGPYRVDRLRNELAAGDALTLDDMKRLQRDLYSLQAERFVAKWQALLPDTPAGALLRSWDCRYDAKSKGAVLFERAYAALLREVFGRRMFGLKAWDALTQDTSLTTSYFARFDAALLGDDPRWYGDEGREALVRRVLADVLVDVPDSTWGDNRQMTMTNILFAGKLPQFLGFDLGPVTLEGGRATPVQCNVFHTHGRLSSFYPSFRSITDLGRDEVLTALSGGPSGRRTSRYYTRDVKRWLEYEYKKLVIEG